MKKLALLLAVFVAVPLAAADRPVLDASRADLGAALRAVPIGESVQLEGLDLGRLELERFTVFTADAKIVVERAKGPERLPIPNNVYLRGTIGGDRLSRVVLSVLDNGIRGIATRGGEYWMIGRGPAAKAPEAGLTVVPVVPELTSGGFVCDTDRLGGSRAVDLPAPAIQVPTAIPEGAPATYGARIAVETDNEFLALFAGDTTAAANYVADLIAFGSTVYSDEVDTALGLTYLRLWDTTDPWAESSTICGLFEFGRYYNDNMGGEFRTIAHFMSGKNNGGGVAWVGVLCNPGFTYDITGNGCSTLSPNVDNYGGGYGFSGTMDGDFDINNPVVVWDIIVTTHEMGHNFNSPHTHCYENVGGNSSAVDNCYAGQCGVSGCYCGTTSLPSGCPGAGQGCGTIMSYCHLLGGGIANVDTSFGNPGGTPFPYGIAPERVPTRMNAHVVSVAGGAPACLASIDDIFADGFESGDTSFWDGVSP